MNSIVRFEGRGVTGDMKMSQNMQEVMKAYTKAMALAMDKVDLI